MKTKKKKNNLLKNLKMTWQFTNGARKKLFLYVLFIILMSLVGAIIPTLTAKQIIYINNSLWDKLLFITLMVLFFNILMYFFMYLSRKAGNIFYRETLKNVQMELSKEILKLEIEEIDKNTSGLFINRLNSDTMKLADIFWQLLDVITNIMTNIGILIAIFLISKIMFLYFIITITILFALNKLRMKYFFEMDKEWRKYKETNTGLMGEMVRGIRDIKVLNAENNFISKISGRITESNNKRYKMSEINRKWDLATNSTNALVEFLFIILGMNLILNDMLSIENLVIIYMYRGRLYNLLNFFVQMLERIKDFNLSADRVFEIFESDIFKKETFGSKVLKKAKGDIEFKNVYFNYENKDNVIKNLNFKINSNEKVAFVGKSGQGKSTIFSLLTKLYHPNKGNIYIDEIDINEFTKESLRNNISIITQMPYIFNMSINENLKIVKPSATKKEIQEVCKSAHLHDFIMTLPNKYDTVVGEGGVTLSGGQRQRLAIARALLTKTEIILFDEATSSLDNETQKEITEAIDNLKGKYTILIVAHRLSTVIDCDRIFVIDGGKVIDVGTHKELMKKSEFYRKLYENET